MPRSAPIDGFSLAYDRHGAGAPATVLRPELDPLFPPVWSDRLGEFFADFELQRLAGVGHFVPHEAPETVAEATVPALRR
jgi:pimeloyl-ACP methyl ester carboxylesterase